MLRQVVCVDRAKMLHVTSWDMAGVKTDVTCYVKLFGVDRVKMDLQRPNAKPVADAICVAVAMAVGPEETLVSGYWSTVAQRSLWMKMLREKQH